METEKIENKNLAYHEEKNEDTFRFMIHLLAIIISSINIAFNYYKSVPWYTVIYN